jgi:polyhydroxyalkanoate synthesis regulator phasin
MALEALRGYVALASGLTEVTRAKAIAQAKALLADENLAPLIAGGAKAGAQVQGVAEEIMASGRANREVVTHLIATEVEKAVTLLSGASREETKALRVSLDRLERRVAVLEAKDASAAAAARTGRAASTSAAKKKPATKKTATKTSTAKKATAGAPTEKQATS